MPVYQLYCDECVTKIVGEYILKKHKIFCKACDKNHVQKRTQWTDFLVNLEGKIPILSPRNPLI